MTAKAIIIIACDDSLRNYRNLIGTKIWNHKNSILRAERIKAKERNESRDSEKNKSEIAKAMGASVTVISRSPKKKTFARDCGADTFIVSESDAQMKAEAGKLDLLINTIPSYHDYMAYQPLLSTVARAFKLFSVCMLDM